MKIGIIGDAHFRPFLRYAEYFADRRTKERQAVLDHIVESFADCGAVVFMGDNLDLRNNTSQVIREFTEFVERFNDKEVYIIAGNHEKSADGKTAIDYLKEIRNPKWHVVTNKIEQFGSMVFCPYFFKEELGVNGHVEATNKVLEMLKPYKGAQFLFIHHAIAGAETISGQMTDLFPEVVLPQAAMEGIFSYVIGGHIHKPSTYGNILVTGCTFSNEVGDTEKFAWKVDTENCGKEVAPWEQVVLPIRPIIKIENPTARSLKNYIERNPHQIVKALYTNPAAAPMDEDRALLRQFDAYILIEQYPSKRTKMDVENGAILDQSIEQLLGIYAKEKNVSEPALLEAWEMIK